MAEPSTVPTKAWVVTAAGMTVNLCLGILYAWSVWKAGLIAPKNVDPGAAMGEPNLGWNYLSDAQATWAYVICGFTFALVMIPGGRLQDRFGPRIGATLGGLFLGLGCVVAGLMQNYLGLILGFGVLGGIGMGLGYAAATPAAVKWFGPHKRGLIVGLVVGGYGAAAVYISPLGETLVTQSGLTSSFVALGILFAVVVVVAGQFLIMPPAGYIAPTIARASHRPPIIGVDRSPGDVLKTWQFYALVGLFIGSAQAGLLVITNAKKMLNETASAADGGATFFVANAWLLASFGGVVNALGRVGTGFYSDAVGRLNAYTINGLAAAVCIAVLPMVMASGSVPLLFLVVGVVFWQYGGTLALMPSIVADYYGSKNMGMNYGLVFLGWGIAFFVPQAGGYIKDLTGSLNGAFYMSAGLLATAVIACRFVKRPV